MQQVDHPAERNRSRPRQRTRQQAQNLDKRPRKRVLESLTHLRETGDGSKRKVGCQRRRERARSCLAAPRTTPHERGRLRSHERPGYLLAAAVFAHLASVFRNGNAFAGGSIVPLSEVLKGTMRP